VTDLRSTWIEPPFSVLDGKNKFWRDRLAAWKRWGFKSEVGRDAPAIHMHTTSKDPSDARYTSIFDPVLAEICYHWFAPKGGSILDPFAGGSVRGIVAAASGYHYTGIELRQEQVDSNREQAAAALPVNRLPSWYVGDSDQVLNDFFVKFDMIFSCPPYFNLEKYSDLPADLSNKDYPGFLQKYASIIGKAVGLLAPGGYAAWVIGEVRDKKGAFVGLVPDTIRIFQYFGMEYYNEIVFLNMIGSASMRANGNMKSRKVVKVHQNVLVFRKPVGI
jgi:DNA modification methylase